MMSLADTIWTQRDKVINIFHCAIYETKQNTTGGTMNLCPTNIGSRDDCVMVLWVAASAGFPFRIVFILGDALWFMRGYVMLQFLQTDSI